MTQEEQAAPWPSASCEWPTSQPWLVEWHPPVRYVADLAYPHTWVGCDTRGAAEATLEAVCGIVEMHEGWYVRILNRSDGEVRRIGAAGETASCSPADAAAG